VLVLAYAGWGDAGDAATSAVRYLIDQREVSPFACIETEEFLDFTVVRPEVKLGADDRREVVWPNHEFFAASLPEQPRDLVLGLGVEPHLLWKAYARSVVELVRSGGIRTVILMGAFLADVIYSQPVQVNASSADPSVAERLGLATPRYEGPTGIVSVLSEAFRVEGIESLSLWAGIPHYVPTRPNWRGAHALLAAAQGIAGLSLDLSELAQLVAGFDERVSKLVADNPQLSAYVRELKRRVFTQ
jgi:predicted ATP-grasp superfamily ATP-dependent carboligase